MWQSGEIPEITLGAKAKKGYICFFVIYQHFKRRKERTDVLSWFLGLRSKRGLVFVLSMFSMLYWPRFGFHPYYYPMRQNLSSHHHTTTTQRKFEVENFWKTKNSKIGSWKKGNTMKTGIEIIWKGWRKVEIRDHTFSSKKAKKLFSYLIGANLEKFD